MEKLIDEVVKYLNTSQEGLPLLFSASNLVEGVIPTTSKPIKKFINKEFLHPLCISNTKTKFIAMPLIKNQHLFDEELLEKYYSYLSYEKEYLIAIKKLLNHKPFYIDNVIHSTSCCGILLSAATLINLENGNRLTKAVNIAHTKMQGIDVYINEEEISPVSCQLIKK